MCMNFSYIKYKIYIYTATTLCKQSSTILQNNNNQIHCLRYKQRWIADILIKS